MSFEIALSGINAINTQLDTISNNIANTGTYGFKSSRANFSSLYAGTQPNGTQVGSLTQTIDVGGTALSTGRGMDVSIQGRGFFVTRDTTGTTLYTRVGIFSTDKDGFVVDSFGRKAQGYAMVDNGAARGPLGDLEVPTGQIAAQASTTLEYTANLSADWTAPSVGTFDPTDALSYNGSEVSVVYDSLGAQHTVTQYFVRSGTNQITVNYTFDGAALGATTTLTFGTDGKLTAPAGTVALGLGTPTGADALAIDIDYSDTTQYAGSTTTTVNSTDGYASGTLVGVNIDEDGSVMAQYSNGQLQSIGTLALAAFPNENALIPVSDTAWTVSNGSGTALLFAPGEGMVGTLTPGALEQSNVDITSQLVDLMSAQRNYQANTKVISTENEMMQNLMQSV